MSYYKILGLEREPFSTSPDPEFFYQSDEHKAVYYRLRVAVELKRGMSLILGDVGTGKTTLSRKLSQLFSRDPNIFMSVILNPVYETEKQFLADLMERFHIPAEAHRDFTVLEYMKVIEKFLFEKGVEEGKTIILLIDEAQKMTPACLEVLRSLLNYETNEYKILQLILMGQKELLPCISQINNLWDRIALKHTLNPLREEEVKDLISFRLLQAGYMSHTPLFTYGAVRAIYQRSQGYPRKIAMLCHNALEYLVMHERKTVDAEMVETLIHREVHPVAS
jgi:general secretion pathway protein A